MDLPQVVALALGSAVVASVISGLFALKANSALLNDAQRARDDLAKQNSEREEREALLADSAVFVDRYVTRGLEKVAAELDRASYEVDVGFRAARRNRSLAAAIERIPEARAASWLEVGQLKTALAPTSLSSPSFAQSSLVPFPSQFMQGLLVLARCIALAQDWLERYPWTSDGNLPPFEEYLQRLPTVLAASARTLEAAAIQTRRLGPYRYLEWPSHSLVDPELTRLGTQSEQDATSALTRAPAAEVAGARPGPGGD